MDSTTAVQPNETQDPQYFWSVTVVTWFPLLLRQSNSGGSPAGGEAKSRGTPASLRAMSAEVKMTPKSAVLSSSVSWDCGVSRAVQLALD